MINIQIQVQQLGNHNGYDKINNNNHNRHNNKDINDDNEYDNYNDNDIHNNDRNNNTDDDPGNYSFHRCQGHCRRILQNSSVLAVPHPIPPEGEGSQKEVLVWELLRRNFFGLEALTPFSTQSSASVLGVAISNNRHPPAIFEQLPGKLRSNDVISQLLNTFFQR